MACGGRNTEALMCPKSGGTVFLRQRDRKDLYDYVSDDSRVMLRPESFYRMQITAALSQTPVVELEHGAGACITDMCLHARS